MIYRTPVHYLCHRHRVKRTVTKDRRLPTKIMCRSTLTFPKTAPKESRGINDSTDICWPKNVFYGVWPFLGASFTLHFHIWHFFRLNFRFHMKTLFPFLPLIAVFHMKREYLQTRFPLNQSRVLSVGIRTYLFRYCRNPQSPKWRGFIVQIFRSFLFF